MEEATFLERLSDVAINGAGATLGKLLVEGVHRNATSIAVKVGARLGEVASTTLPPGLFAQIFTKTGFVDDGMLQDLWADLIADALQGKVTTADLQWAMQQLETLTPESALAIALVTHRGRAFLVEEPGAPNPMDRTLHHLVARALLRVDGEAGWLGNEGNVRRGIFDSANDRKIDTTPGLVVVTMSGIGRDCTSTAKRYNLAVMGEELCRLTRVGAVTGFGGWDANLMTVSLAKERVLKRVRDEAHSRRR